MVTHRTDTAALIAGALAGIAGLLAFLALHTLWIVPIWFILPVGLLLAGSGGLAVGWAHDELKSRLPRCPWTALAVVGIIALILLPAFVLAELVGWWLGRTRRAALATGVAGFVFALGPGHNIPLIGGTPGVGKELAIMTAVTFVSALVLVEGHASLVTRRGLFTRTNSGQVYPFSAYASWLAETGFTDVECIHLGAAPPISMICARRPH